MNIFELEAGLMDYIMTHDLLVGDICTLRNAMEILQRESNKVIHAIRREAFYEKA